MSSLSVLFLVIYRIRERILPIALSALWFLAMCACTSDVGRNLERIERQVATAPDSAYSALCAIDRLQIVESTENAMRYLGFGLMRSFGQEDIEIIDTIVNEAIIDNLESK